MVGEWNGVVRTVVERTVLDGLPLRRRMHMTAVDRCRKRECVHVRVRDGCARVVDAGVCGCVWGGEACFHCVLRCGMAALRREHCSSGHPEATLTNIRGQASKIIQMSRLRIVWTLSVPR